MLLAPTRQRGILLRLAGASNRADRQRIATSIATRCYCKPSLLQSLCFTQLPRRLGAQRVQLNRFLADGGLRRVAGENRSRQAVTKLSSRRIAFDDVEQVGSRLR